MLLLLWLKAFHVVAVVTWFAGLFYLPRLFVYHAAAGDAIGIERFKVMERRLLTLTTVGGTASVALGASMLAVQPLYLSMGWLHWKLALVILLIGFHGLCFRFTRQFALDRNVRTARWYRMFNEVPSLLLVGIVILAVLKP